MGIRNGGHIVSLGEPKQEAHVELFDGEPLYHSRWGDLSRSQILRMDTPTLMRAGELIRLDDRMARLDAYDADYCDAHIVVPDPNDRSKTSNLVLRPVNYKYCERNHNVITQLGLNGLADKIIGGSDITLPTGMKVGGATTPASTGDTDIITVISDTADDFQAWSSGYPQRSTSTATWRAFWDAGEAQVNPLNEVVMKSADGSTDAISRIVFSSPVDKSGASDTLQITINWAMTEGA